MIHDSASTPEAITERLELVLHEVVNEVNLNAKDYSRFSRTNFKE